MTAWKPTYPVYDRRLYVVPSSCLMTMAYVLSMVAAKDDIVVLPDLITRDEADILSAPSERSSSS